MILNNHSMCDLSEYDIPSEEWLLLASTLPPTSDMGAEELKKATNAARAVAAENLMKQLDLTSEVAIQDHLIPARDGDQIEARTCRSLASSSHAKRSYLSTCIFMEMDFYMVHLNSKIRFALSWPSNSTFSW